MPETVSRWTGQRATLLRRATRLSIEDFATRLGVSSRLVKHWASHPTVEPRPNTQQILDTAFQLFSGEVRGRFHQLVSEAETVESSISAPVLVTIPPLPAVLAGAPSGRREPTSEMLANFRQTLRHLYQTDNYFGPRVLAPLIGAHLKEIGALRDGARGNMLRDLLGVGAAYAEFAGWLAQDSNEHEKAVRWYNQGLEWAQVAGDVRMTAFIRMRLAARAISAKDGEYAVLWASAAQQDNFAETTRIRIISTLTEAHGHAIRGHSGEVNRALDNAQKLIEGDTPVIDGDPTIGRYCELPLYFSITRAKCNLELGRGVEALDDFGEILTVLPPSYQRDRGQYMAGLAHAHVLAGQPEHACAVAEESLAIALETGSTRTVASLARTVRQGIRHWPDLVELTELSTRLKAVSDTNGGA